METPENVEYLLLGLAATAVFLVVFIGSMVARYRSLQKDAELVENLARGEE